MFVNKTGPHWKGNKCVRNEDDTWMHKKDGRATQSYSSSTSSGVSSSSAPCPAYKMNVLLLGAESVISLTYCKARKHRVAMPGPKGSSNKKILVQLLLPLQRPLLVPKIEVCHVKCKQLFTHGSKNYSITGVKLLTTYIFFVLRKNHFFVNCRWWWNVRKTRICVLLEENVICAPANIEFWWWIYVTFRIKKIKLGQQWDGNLTEVIFLHNNNKTNFADTYDSSDNILA